MPGASAQEVVSYRPIAVTSHIMKVMEKLVLACTYAYFYITHTHTPLVSSALVPACECG